MKTSFYRRHGLVFLILAAISLPFIAFGAMSATNSNENVMANWLPPHFQETKRLQWFVDRFGTTEMLVVTWDGCRLDNPEIEPLVDALKEPVPVSSTKHLELFERVLSGPEMMRKLTSAPFNLKRERALERMQGWLVGPDHESTCIVALLNTQGEAYRHEAVDWICQNVQERCDVSQDEVILSGPAIDSVAIDRTSTNTIRPLNFLCWGICLAIAAIAIRMPRVAVMMFVIALFCQYLSLAIVFYSGQQMNSILFMVASLVFVLCVSAAVHMVNYYREAIDHQGLDGAPGRAVKDALLPCWLAAGTTALGMASLTVSSIEPIYTFGVYAAIGVLSGLAVMMLLLPAWLERWPAWKWATAKKETTLPPAGQTAWPKQPDGGVWRHWANFVIRFHRPIAAVSVVCLLATGWGLSRLQTTVNLHDMFSARARVIHDYAWVQERVGPMVPIEVVLRMPKSDDARMLDRMQLVELVRREIADVDFVGSTVTAASFGPKLPSGGSVRSTIRRTLVNRELEKHRDTFKDVHYLSDTANEELWRISVRVEARKRMDYGEFLDYLQARIDPFLGELVARDDRIPKVTATLCGGVPLINKAQTQLLSDLLWSFVTAFILVGFTMIFVLRSFVGGALSMIPNIVPSVIVFGLLGWFNVVIDIGAMMTASVALGIAVDDTLHFVVWFRRGLDRGYDRKTAIRYSYQRCGTAMLQTSLICGVGLLGYAFSPFVPISRFSWLMSFMLFGAIAGDLVVLPALLASPLGRFFEVKHTSRWRPILEPLWRPVRKLPQFGSATYMFLQRRIMP